MAASDTIDRDRDVSILHSARAESATLRRIEENLPNGAENAKI